jgi:hypothetical protein
MIVNSFDSVYPESKSGAVELKVNVDASRLASLEKFVAVLFIALKDEKVTLPSDILKQLEDLA